MALPIIMPQIGQDIPTGRIVQWLVREGEAVSKGDVIVTVESDKTVFEVEAEAIVEISREISESAEAARRGTMKVQAEGTFTISNLGMYEVDRFLPIINPPEAGEYAHRLSGRPEKENHEGLDF